MKKCIGIMGSLFGHKLEPKFDVTPVEPDWPGAVQGEQWTYLGDVCRRCTATVNRDALPLADGQEEAAPVQRSVSEAKVDMLGRKWGISRARALPFVHELLADLDVQVTSES